MSQFLENLQTCIEKYTIDTVSGPTTYFYDSRFGTRIPDRILHPSYKRCFSAIVQPVKEVKSITREENNFHLCIISNNSHVQIMVRFYPIDKTFICRDYDPTVIIPAILTSDSKTYLQNKDHPFYKFGYVADYSWHPNLLEESPRKDVTTAYEKTGLSYTNELDWYEASNTATSKTSSVHSPHVRSSDEYGVQEPHSDCDSCGSSAFGADDPDETIAALTIDDIKELNDLFKVYTNDEKEEPEEILNTMNLNDSMIGDRFKIPKLPLNKLRFDPINPSPEDNEYQKKVQEQMRMKNLEIIRLREVQQLMETMEEHKPINMDIIPKIEERDDNLEY